MQQEWGKVLGNDFKMITAFSRAVAEKKTYVQDKMREHAKDINKLLLEDATLYVCGDAVMAKDVSILLEHLVAEERVLPLEGGVATIKKMRANGKYQEDAWS